MSKGREIRYNIDYYLDEEGNKFWRNNKAQFHRENDNPAIIKVNGDIYWYQDGNLHRNNDKPARINNKDKYWYQNNKCHRDNDKPAIISSNGDKWWYKNGNQHRILGYIEKFGDEYEWNVECYDRENGNILRIIRIFMNKF